MIIIKLQGGLGNQMFQYALGKKLELIKNKKVAYDYSYFTHKESWPFELHLFGITLNKIKGIDKLKLPSAGGGIINRIKWVYQRLFPVEIIKQTTFSFDNRFLNAPDRAYLEGYWQTELYFSDIRKVLLNDFKFTVSDIINKSALHTLITDTESVSIHIRRGDYISDTTNLFRICDWNYYLKAIDSIIQKTKNPHFVFFSDDPEWCLENIKIDHPFTVVTPVLSGSSFTDMYLMSLCKHNIIANSSFSWWAAWLNKNPDKNVVGPDAWFADGTINTEDIIPASWLKI